MLFKFFVSHALREDLKNELLFDKSPITIGRLADNDLVLADQELIVGRRHAEIHVLDGFPWLVDVGSKNFTFLNGQKIEPTKRYQLRHGDGMDLGKFHIRFEIVPVTNTDPLQEERSTDETATHELPNPFLEYTKRIAEVIQQMKADYLQMNPDQRDIVLEKAIRRELRYTQQDEMGQKILGMIWPEPVAAPVPQALPEPMPSGKPGSVSDFVPFSHPNLQNPAEWERLVSSSYALNREGLILKRMAVVDDVLLKLVDKLTKIPAHFRLEFLGHSFVPHPYRFPFHTASVEHLKAWLYDIHVDPEELRRRLLEMEQLVNEVLAHEVGMLEGYKFAVMSGVEKMLETMNPDYIRALAEKEGQDLHKMGVFSHAKWLQIVRQAHAEWMQEDRNQVEKADFRPAFIKAYLARTDAARHSGT